MTVQTFDDFNESDYAQQERSIAPFQFREDKSKKGTLEWLKTNFEDVYERSQSRLEQYSRWSYLYKGIHWRTAFRASRDHEGEVEYNEKKPKMSDNFVWELITNKVSAMRRLGTSFVAIPWNNEQSDVNSAKACELLLKSRALEIELDDLHSDADLLKYKYGTVFMYNYWDSEKGPDHPAYKRLKEIYKGQIPNNILKKLKKQMNGLKVGDTCTEALPPYKLFPEVDKDCWTKVNHIDVLDWTNIHELRADYPNLKDQIQPNNMMRYDVQTNEISQPEHMVPVRKFYHKPTKHLPEGAYIKYTDDVILEWTAYPYNHGELPIVVDRDIIIDGELWGRPKISNIDQKQRQYNNIESGIARDLGIGSAPKWLIPKNSISNMEVTNDFSIMEYKGPIKPELAKMNPVSDQAIMQQDRNEKRMSRLMNVYDVSRGNVPQGFTANAALRFLDEQESQANADDESRRKTRVLSTYRQQLQLMGQYYHEADGRTARIMGKNNEYMIEAVKNANFSKVYDIQLQNTSALPDTKTGKIAAIVDLNAATQKDPIFRKEQVIRMLDMGMEDGFVDQATASTNTAHMIFDSMLKGEQVEEPAMHDDLLVHYSVFFRGIQDYGFRTRVQGELKQAFYQRIKIMEGLLWAKSMYSPKTKMELQRIDYYPAFFKPPMPTPGPDYEGVQKEMQTSKMDNTEKAVEGEIERQNENK